MTTLKITPGPWKIIRAVTGYITQIDDAEDDSRLLRHHRGGQRTGDRRRAGPHPAGPAVRTPAPVNATRANEDDQDPPTEQETCAHALPDGSSAFVYTGRAYGGDDERWCGEGRCYCSLCGQDGDA